MRILYDHQIFSVQKYGGISRYFYEIIKRIAEKNRVLLYEGYHINNYGLDKLDIFDKKFARKRIEIPFRGLGRLTGYLNAMKLKSFSRKFPVDIYHPTYYEDFNLNNGRIFVTVYDMIHELFKNDGEFKGDNTIHRKKTLINKSSGIIAISESTKNDLMKIYDLNPDKIKVIYLANSLDIEVKKDAVLNEPYILIVGHGAGYKNFSNFIKAFSVSKFKNDIKCVCFGGGAFSKQEIEIMKKLSVEDRIIYYQGSDELLANLYKYAQLFVYPSKYEGFGLPPLEAMHYGTPVLVSNTSSIPEVVGNAGMYFDPNSVDDIAEKMDCMLNDSILRKEYGQKGIAREKIFSWDKCARETVEFYKEVLEGR